MTHTTRKQAQAAYDAALIAVRNAETISEEAWVKANTILDEARTALISAESQFPTPKETKRYNNYMKLANRGLDVF